MNPPSLETRRKFSWPAALTLIIGRDLRDSFAKQTTCFGLAFGGHRTPLQPIEREKPLSASLVSR